MVNNSTAVKFTPTAGFSGIADFNYTVCDAQGACDIAVVNICVLGSGSDYETLEVFTKEDTPQVIIAALENFEINVDAMKGSLSDATGVWVYSPIPGALGTDTFSFIDNTTQTVQEVVMTILDAPARRIFMRDDLAFVAIDSEIEITPLENDIASSAFSGIHLVGGSSITTPNGGSVSYDYNGGFYYIPAAGFEGEDQFQYRAQVPAPTTTYETATVKIVVSNHKPSQGYYSLITPEATPLVLSLIHI